MERKIRRRDFLKVSAVAVFGGIVAACTPAPTAAPEATKAAPAVEPTKPAAAAASKEALCSQTWSKAANCPPSISAFRSPPWSSPTARLRCVRW